MPSLTIRRKQFAAACMMACAAILLATLASLSLRQTRIAAQDFPAVVGRIEGDDLEVATNTPTGVERDASPTVVASGSDVTLRSGRALLLLNAGGEINICGPAHFKLIKSNGALTVALDYGRIHSSFESSDAFTIYTPTIVATPIAISGGSRDVTVGLGQSGEMCVLTAHGAMRVEPQFSEQSVIVPQGGTVSLVGGQIDSLKADASACACDYPRARMIAPPKLPPPPAASRPEPNAADIGALAPPLPQQQRKTQNATPPAASEPVYTVLMPPLSFDANSPEPPPDPAPETIMLVREVRLRPSAEFRGHVNPAPAETVAVQITPPAPAAPAAPAPAATSPAPPAAAPQPGIFSRVRNFFRKLTGKAPCAGAGCSG